MVNGSKNSISSLHVSALNGLLWSDIIVLLHSFFGGKSSSAYILQYIK